MENLLSTISSTLKYWYIPMVIGLVFIFFGGYIFTVPLQTYLTLSVLFSVGYILSGITEIYFAITNRDSLESWGWYLVGGILTLAMGCYLIIYPQISMIILPLIVGFTMLFRSMQGLAISFDLRKAGILSWGNLALTSVFGIVLSFTLLANPVFTGVSIVTLTALVFIFVGIMGIVLSVNLKKIKKLPQKIGNEIRNKVSSQMA